MIDPYGARTPISRKFKRRAAVRVLLIGAVCLGLGLAVPPSHAQTSRDPGTKSESEKSATGSPAAPLAAQPAPAANSDQPSHDAMVEEQERRDREEQAERDRDDQ
jgi:hypothetical protein